ncbi:DUF3137 domain-containing protein [Natronoglycomyces albus]|uniref:DUF3137 domain-containing protein n=1 Tax=Natronoglycomyces albus TaxID=2811108 RepID=A0A895XL21_9ACTN|nr:DUF3137 domain-containing protein [Natronoglycomyces albus]QSB05767.1 DUF3137 domain-containing protein [Natronoglycomyces albus]
MGTDSPLAHIALGEQLANVSFGWVLYITVAAAVLGFVFYRRGAAARERNGRYRTYAEKYRLTYWPRDFGMLGFSKVSPFGVGGNRLARFVFEGPYHDTELVTFEYSYQPRALSMRKRQGPNNSQKERFQVVALRLPHTCPFLQLSPNDGLEDNTTVVEDLSNALENVLPADVNRDLRDWLDRKVGSILKPGKGKNELAFDNPVFDYQFNVTSPDARFAEHVLTEELMQWLLEQDKALRQVIRIEGNWLMTFVNSDFRLKPIRPNARFLHELIAHMPEQMRTSPQRA